MSTYDSTEDTQTHIEKVQYYLLQCAQLLSKRAMVHDKSKLESPEKEGFDAAYDLRTIEYGTPEYDKAKANLGVTLTHHYEHNDHHPEHYEQGVDSMNLLAITEMLMDWKAATERMKDGDIYKSIQINKERFGLSDQLTNILVNTAEDMGW